MPLRLSPSAASGAAFDGLDDGIAHVGSLTAVY
jgi:hypothetical protein